MGKAVCKESGAPGPINNFDGRSVDDNGGSVEKKPKNKSKVRSQVGMGSESGCLLWQLNRILEISIQKQA